MKLSEYAKRNSITYRTAWKHYKEGLIPNARQISTGTIVVDEDKSTFKEEYVVCYARVSSSENKKNLKTQAKRLVRYSNAKGYIVKEVVKECASGLNDNRQKLTKVLSNEMVTKIVVEHQDRLARFGIKFIKLLLKQRGCTIEVINEAENSEQDLMQDFVSIITSFCARLYGLRRSRRKTDKIIKVLKEKK